MENRKGVEAVVSAFDKVSRAEWMEKITTDLKGKEMSSLNWEFDNDLNISPFANSEDVNNRHSDIAFDPKWELAEEFDVSDEAVSNAEILEALSFGAETIMLVVHDVPDWSVLLKDVALEMIKTYVIPDEGIGQAVIASIKEWLEAQGNAPDATISVRSGGGLTMDQANLRAEKSAIDVLVHTLKQGISATEDGYDDEHIECVAHIGDSFFVEVARLRALKILWHNILAATSKSGPTLFVESRFAPEAMNSDVHMNMISAGSKALAAICGGSDRVLIAPSDPEADLFSRRISRNIHHIFRMESKLDTIPDPVQGSWYLEKLTAQMVEAAWKQLTED